MKDETTALEVEALAAEKPTTCVGGYLATWRSGTFDFARSRRGLHHFSVGSYGITAFSAFTLGFAIMSLYSINSVFSFFSTNSAFSLLSLNSFASVLSTNSAFSVLSVSSYASYGCSGEKYKICYGD